MFGGMRALLEPVAGPKGWKMLVVEEIGDGRCAVRVDMTGFRGNEWVQQCQPSPLTSA